VERQSKAPQEGGIGRWRIVPRRGLREKPQFALVKEIDPLNRPAVQR
jgi:hypothetical protein